MLTVNIRTKHEQTTVMEETLEVKRVRHITSGFCPDGHKSEEVGVEFHFDDEGSLQHYSPRNDGFWYDIFVMNEAGQTVNRLIL